MPVLDIEGGMARLMGNTAIYFKALRRFTVHIDAARGVAAQLAAGDQTGAHRTVHTLHGAAGLLGAGELRAIAFDVETALTRGQQVQKLLEELEGALERVQARIDTVLLEHAGARDETTTPAVPEAPVPPVTDVPALLDRLAALLDEGNSAAIDVVEKYGTVLENALGATAWETVSTAAMDYDFEHALAALQSTRLATVR